MRGATGKGAARALLTLGPPRGARAAAPRRGAVVVVHEERPAGSRVDLDLPPAGGRGSRSLAPLPDAICTMGEWVAALMLGRGSARRGGRRGAGLQGAGSRGAGSRGRGVPDLQV